MHIIRSGDMALRNALCGGRRGGRRLRCAAPKTVVKGLQYFTKTVCLYKLSEEGDRKIPEVSSVLHLAVTVF